MTQLIWSAALSAALSFGAPAPSKTPLPEVQGIDFAKKDREVEECGKLAASYKSERQAADFAARNCQLHLFHTACNKARQIAEGIKSATGPCSYVLEKSKLSAFPVPECETLKLGAASRCSQDK